MKIDIPQILIEHKLKITEGRKALITLIANEEKPVDAQFLIEQLQESQGIDRVTVFRILNVLTGHGILQKLEFGEGKARYEFSTKEHHHLICESCGAIEDVSDCNIGALEEDISRKKKFHINRHSLEFFGLCAACFREHGPHSD